jgi:hypothetical protein
MGFLDNLFKEVIGPGARSETKDSEENVKAWTATLFQGPFRKNKKVTKANLSDALNSVGANDGDRWLAEMRVEEQYGLAQSAALEDLLTSLLQRIAVSQAAADLPVAPPPIVSLRVGGKISKSRSSAYGSIGGFLTNGAKVFLFSDAHVIVQDPWQENQSNEVFACGVAVGKVVYHGKIALDKTPNYDVALAEVYPAMYDKINLEYHREGSANRRAMKSDSSLTEGKVVYLYGATSATAKEGRITTPTGDPRQVWYHQGDKKLLVELHDLVQVQNPDPSRQPEFSLEGDSGGLWIGDDGAAGIQIAGGAEDKEASILPMDIVLKFFHKFDPSLAFLTTTPTGAHTGSNAASKAAAV